MRIVFSCEHCGRELNVDERLAGRRVRCPDCAKLLVIPEPNAETPEPEELPPQQIDESFVELEPVEEPLPEPPPVISPPPKQRAAVAPSPPPKSAAAAAKSEKPPIILPHRKHPEDLIDMTAMVDIVFFLLIFFLVTSLQALEAVMDLPTPQAAEGGASSGKSVADLENDPNFITVRIEDDDSIWVEDQQVFNDQDLRVKLKAARQEGGKSRSLLVLGDADASHGAAVRVFDAGAGAGVDNISFLVQEKSAGGP